MDKQQEGSSSLQKFDTNGWWAEMELLYQNRCNKIMQIKNNKYIWCMEHGCSLIMTVFLKTLLGSVLDTCSFVTALIESTLTTESTCV